MNALISQAQTSDRRVCRRPSLSGSLAILAAASLFASAVSACGSETKPAETTTSPGTATATATTPASPTPGAPLPEAAKLLEDCEKTTHTLRTIHVDLAATNMSKLPVESLNADVNSEDEGNAKAAGDAMFRKTPTAPFENTVFIVTDKTFYVKGPDGKYNSVGDAKKIYDPAVVLSKEKGLANVIKNVKDPKVEARETIDGVATVKVSGTIEAAIIDPLVPTLGKEGQLPITLYVQDIPKPPAETTRTSIPSEAPSPGKGPNLVRFAVNKDQGSVQVTLSNWAKPVTIPSPTG